MSGIIKGIDNIYDALKRGNKLVPIYGGNYIYPDKPILAVHGLSGNYKQTRDNKRPPGSKRVYPKITLEEAGFPILEAKVAGYGVGDMSEVLYIYANSQMNLTYAKLENEDEVAYPIDLFMIKEGFTVYEEAPVKEITIQEIEEKLGYKIKIVEK